MKLLEYLCDKGVDFEVRHHREAYTAQEEAESQRLPGRMFGKTVVVKAGEGFVMLVLPATGKVDLDLVENLLGARVRLATEEELARLFPDSELGAEPPFGSQYDMPTVVDEALAGQGTIAVRACKHTAVVLLTYADFARLEAPRVASFCQKKAA